MGRIEGEAFWALGAVPLGELPDGKRLEKVAVDIRAVDYRYCRPCETACTFMDELEERDPAFREALRRALAGEGTPLEKEELRSLILGP